MTSNTGARNITQRRKSLGFSQGGEPEERSYEEIKELVTADLKNSFRPEFLNRIDEIIVFRQLTQEDIRLIAGEMLEAVRPPGRKGWG